MDPRNGKQKASSALPDSEARAASGRSDASGSSEAVAALADAVVRDDIAAALALRSPLQVTTHWADGFCSCTYHLPTGRLVLSVGESPTLAAAAACFAALRRDLVAAWLPMSQSMPGCLGCGSPRGTVVVLSGCRVLVADATGLPPVCGSRMIARVDLAHRVAVDVIALWVDRSHRQECCDVHV